MASKWEEQSAMVQMEDAGGEVPELAGVFLTRETAEQKRPDRMRAWSPHFAFAPLGDGPVLRSIENSSMAPPAERERILALARSAQLPVQIGLTQGGTDGTTFTFWGAPNAGLSWPG